MYAWIYIYRHQISLREIHVDKKHEFNIPLFVKTKELTNLLTSV